MHERTRAILHIDLDAFYASIELVNGANVRRFLSRNVGIWRETEESTIEKLEKPLQS